MKNITSTDSFYLQALSSAISTDDESNTVARELLAEIFRDWFNNFLTRDRFAEYHGFTNMDIVTLVIETGRKIHESECK